MNKLKVLPSILLNYREKWKVIDEGSNGIIGFAKRVKIKNKIYFIGVSMFDCIYIDMATVNTKDIKTIIKKTEENVEFDFCNPSTYNEMIKYIKHISIVTTNRLDTHDEYVKNFNPLEGILSDREIEILQDIVNVQLSPSDICGLLIEAERKYNKYASLSQFSIEEDGIYCDNCGYGKPLLVVQGATTVYNVEGLSATSFVELNREKAILECTCNNREDITENKHFNYTNLIKK